MKISDIADKWICSGLLYVHMEKICSIKNQVDNLRKVPNYQKLNGQKYAFILFWWKIVFVFVFSVSVKLTLGIVLTE